MSEDENDKKVVLVTGGTGLVGHALQWLVNEANDGQFYAHEDERWIFISSKDCDLRDFEATQGLFRRLAPTYVIHLAAKVGGLFANMKENHTFLRDNMLINDSVLQNCHDFQVRKVVSCLSSCIFPHKVTEYPMKESDIHMGPPHESNFGYAMAKRMIDVMNHAYFKQYGDQFTSVVPCNVFGPHDNFDLESGHVIPALIHKAYLAKTQGKELVVAGSGKPLRQFIYSRDLAMLLVWALRKYEAIVPIITSVPEDDEISIEEVARMVAGHDTLKWTDEATDADGQLRKPVSNEMLMALLRYTEYEFDYTPFDQALQDTIDWFEENYATGSVRGVTLPE